MGDINHPLTRVSEGEGCTSGIQHPTDLHWSGSRGWGPSKSYQSHIKVHGGRYVEKGLYREGLYTPILWTPSDKH